MGRGLLGKDGFYGWVSLTGAGMSMFFMAFVQVSFGVFLPIICKELDWRRGDVSIAFFMYFMLMSFVASGAGFFVHKYGARRSIIIGNTLIALGLMAVAFMLRQWQFIGLYAVMGVGAGFSGYMACNTIATSWFIKKAPLTIGIVLALAGLGGMAGAPLIMAFASHLQWRTVYLLVAGIIFLFGVIIPAILVRNKPEDLGQAPDGLPVSSSVGRAGYAMRKPVYVTPVDFTLKETLRTAAFWYVNILVVGDVFMSSIIMPHQIAYLTGMGIGRQTAALTVGLLMGMRAVGTLAFGALALKFNLRKLAIGTVGLVIMGMLLTLVSVSAPIAFAYSIVLGVGYGAGLVAATAFLPAYFGRSHFSKIMGVGSIANAVGGLGAPVAGYIFDATGSYRPSMALGLGIALLILVCMILVRPPVHPSLKQPVTEGVRDAVA
jgi:MFS family permease